MATQILPLELIDKCLHSRIHVVLKSNREFVGVLTGFDDFVNMVLEDAEEWELLPAVEGEGQDGKTRWKKTKLGQTLINGNNVALMIPGGEGPE
ncbi:Sm-like ribonucleoprotein, partial [Atractiella rhizophila]